MPLRKALPLVLIGLSIVACGRAPAEELTLAQAAERVLAEVVRPEGLSRPVLVFAWPTALQPGDVLHPYKKEGFGPFPEPTTIESEAWFFWIDDAPGAQFVHPNRFVLVDRASGEIQVSEEEWWPVLNGEGLWLTEEAYWNPDNWVYGNFEATPLQHRSQSGTPLTALAAVPPSQASPGAAIVINGWEAGERGEENFAADADGMHDLLTESGFDVTYLGPSEDNNPDRDGQPTFEAKMRWFSDQARRLKPGDSLVVYVTGHGGVLSDGDGSLGGVFESFLASWLEEFNPGVHIIVILQGCQSGAFQDGLNRVADVTVTATNATDPSYGDLDFDDDPNPEDRGSEYTSGYIEDWRELLNDPQEKANLEARASRNGTNLWEEVAALSHVSAAEKDVSFQRGWSFPSVRRGNPATTRLLVTPTLVPTPSPPPSQAGTYQVTAEVASDPAKHEQWVGLPESFTLTVAVSPALTFEGEAPWVPVTGTLQADGTFFADGKGPVAGYSDILVTLEGAFVADGFTAEYVMGAGGGLPSGQPIVFHLEGTLDTPAPTATPAAESGQQEETVEAFVEAFNQAFRDQDVDFLVDRLHPKVIQVYGEEACVAYVESVLDPELDLQITSVEGPEPWIWEVDERRFRIPSAYAIEGELSTRGETRETAGHFAPVDGRLHWFTDCGDPLQ